MYVGEGVRVEKWPKQCMHMWISEQQQQKKIFDPFLIDLCTEREIGI
jgi:hypothetical protein